MRFLNLHLRFFLIASLLLGAVTSAAGQVQHEFAGMKRTRLQYLDVRVPSLSARLEQDSLPTLVDANARIDSTYLSQMRQTLVNLPAFTNASFSVHIAKDTGTRPDTTVRWTMEESRTVFPIVNFGGIEGNSFYQIGFNDIHFRGRGQELTSFYQNIDGEHNYLVLLRNQSYRGSRWGYALESRRYAAIEPIFFPGAAVDYQYVNQSFGAGLSYTTDNLQTFFAGVTTFRERYRKLAGTSLETPGPRSVDLDKVLFKLAYGRNRLNRFDERWQGTFYESTAQLVRTQSLGDNFLILLNDFRYYYLVGNRANLAFRLRTGISSNDESPFAPFVLDSQVNIRGSGNRIDRGTAQLVLNVEYRHSVWREGKGRFAAQVVGFSDIGTWRKPGGSLADLWNEDMFRHFIGGGVRLISLKAHDAVIRLDYGVDVYNTRERGFVAGFGQYF